jgi:tetratricopeptide (TPR) repeat protein
MFSRAINRFQRAIAARLCELGRPASARRLLQSVLRRDPADVLAREWLVRAQVCLEDWSASAAESRLLTEQAPTRMYGWVELGAALAHLGRHEEAIVALRAAAERAPYYGRLQVQLGRSYLESAQLQEALMSSRRAASLNPDDSYALDHTSYVLGRLGHHAESVEWARKAMAIAPHESLAYRLGVGLIELGQFAEAEAALRTALAFNPDNLETPVRLAVALAAQRKFAEAAGLIESHLTSDDADPLALWVLSGSWYSLEQTTLAIRAARRRTEISPTDPGAHAFLGRILLCEGQLEQAETEIDWAVSLAPDDYRYLADKAAVDSALGRHETAIRGFQRVLSIEPKFSTTIPTCRNTGTHRRSDSRIPSNLHAERTRHLRMNTRQTNIAAALRWPRAGFTRRD